MAPPDPKRPPRPPSAEEPGALEALDEPRDDALDAAVEKTPDEELPFDEAEVVPLQADDPRPQRVPQFPAGRRRRARRGEGRKDRELAARYEPDAPAEEPQRFLYVERGPGAGQLLPVRPGSLTIGRSSASHLRLSHPSISRRHAELTRHGERFALRDLRSQNGTFVNRTRVRGEVEVFCGDELRLGSAVLRLRGAGAPRRPEGLAVARVQRSSRQRALRWAIGAALLAALVVAGALEVAAPPRRAPSPGAAAAVLTRYRDGDLDAALALAREEGLPELAAQLTRVRDTWVSAERQVREGRAAEALAELRAAQELDAALASGDGPLARELRRSLSRVHGLLGAQRLAAGQSAGAADSFRAALRLDADNAEARSALEHLQAAH